MLLNNIYRLQFDRGLHSLFNPIFTNQNKTSSCVETSRKTTSVCSVNKSPTKSSCGGVTFGCIFKLLAYFKREVPNFLWKVFVVCVVQAINIHISFCVNTFYIKQSSVKYIIFFYSKFC